MSKRRYIALAAMLVIVIAATAASAEGLAVRLVKGDAAPLTVELEKLEKVEGVAYYRNSKGVVSGPFKIKGVKLADLLKLAGGMTAEEKLIFTASDGYVTELSFAQANGELAASRPDGAAFEGKPALVPVIITWSEPDMAKDLPRLAFIADVEGGLMTESKYWARNLVEIRIAPADRK
ncbi:MAG: hypothetical protein KBB09_00075 [Firmicutes bacterium]|nr:hypothetical protein [Bacillota bacterium]